MKNVVVIGAGIGGLFAAEKLASSGHNVVVIEARPRYELGYPWYDSVNPNTFREVGLNVPSEILIPKQVLQYRSPSGKGKIKQPDRAKNSLDVHRKGLIDFLIGRAEERCRVLFGEPVTDFLLEGDWVKGVRTSSAVFPADLVIDSSGVFSVCRRRLPASFLMDDPIRAGDCIEAFREVYSLREGKRNVKPNVYLYPVGLMLAWSKEEPEKGGVDVFLGSDKAISEGEKAQALAFLREREPCLGDRLLFSYKESIPLRYPLAVLVGNGYAAVGNAAFMTRPFCGSGIETALVAARDLVSAVDALKDKPCSVENLWKYNLRFNRKFGAFFSAQYVFRQVIEKLPPEDIDYIFTSGLFDEGIVALATLDRAAFKRADLGAFYRGIRSVWQRKNIVEMAKVTLSQAVRAYFLARSIPSRYDFSKVKRWKEEFDAFMQEAPDKIKSAFRSL